MVLDSLTRIDSKTWPDVSDVDSSRQAGSVGGDYAEVGNVVSLLERGNGVDVENDAGDRSARLGDEFAEGIGDGAKLHSGGNVGSALDEGIPDSRAVGEDVGEFFNPHGIFDWMRIAREDFEGAHGAEGAVDEEGEVVGFDGAGMAGFDDDGGFATDGGSVIEVASGGGIGGALAPDNDVIKAEREDHFLGDAILLFPSRRSPVGVGAEAFVEVAAVIVDEEVTAVDDLFGDEEGGALGLRAVGFAGVEAVHAFVVDRIDVWDFLLKGSDVDERNEDDDAGDLGGVESIDKFFDGDDGGVFGAVSAGDEGESLAGFCAVHDYDGNVGGGVHAGGDFEVAGGFLAGGGGGGADGEGGLRVRSNRKEKREKDGRENRTKKTHQSPPRGDGG